ncbi:hypothetical protein INS49_004408 [Diaporthe citri]|uniref:uncharacterized protein n=1 Tax=Diaporthe citri TaxID=83186 RepID=UPI001C8239FC|nr:uncharacterized protein INS49_004408 [Diaporthe citri]KAG6354391.1 hypothetical protein INS49_004408 [Diaporthe citri]
MATQSRVGNAVLSGFGLYEEEDNGATAEAQATGRVKTTSNPNLKLRQRHGPSWPRLDENAKRSSTQMLGWGHPVAWRWGDGTLAFCGAYCGKSAMQYFVAGLVAADAVIMAAVDGAGTEEFGNGKG